MGNDQNKNRWLYIPCDLSTYMGKKLECQRCGHKWEYRGRNIYYATCPHCRTKVSVRKAKNGLIEGKEKIKNSDDVFEFIANELDEIEEGFDKIIGGEEEEKSEK